MLSFGALLSGCDVVVDVSTMCAIVGSFMFDVPSLSH